MTKATKQPKATQKATKPQTEEKFLTSKDLAKMAKVEPRELRRCLRTHFKGRITATKGDNGLKTYRIPANDPVVKEILAKLKGNGDKGKAAKPAKAQADKGEGEPSPESTPESQFNYKGYQFTVHKDFTVTVINPDNSSSYHNCLASALHQRGFGFKKLEKEGVLPRELTEVKL